MQNHHIERHEKPAVANSIAKLARLCKGREERFFIMRNSEFGMRNEKSEREINASVCRFITNRRRSKQVGARNSAFIIPNYKKKTPSEEKPRKGNAIAHNQHISGEGQRTLTAGPLRNAAGQ